MQTSIIDVKRNFSKIEREERQIWDWKDGINIGAFFAVHAICLAAFWTGVDGKDILLCAASFVIRMFGITGGYHRYFSHKTYRVNRVMQFIMAWIGCSSAQKGPLWWAAHHRRHHQNSDTPEDIHSPVRDGFWWSHVGWILSSKYNETNYKIIPDLTCYPELMWINKHFLVPPVVWGALCLLIGGGSGLVWGFFISTTILWHATFLINSAAHVVGRRRFPTTDTSRNNFVLALITLGEGWHNNHHYFPSSVNQGFYWWELDVTYLVLRVMEFLGLTKNMRRPTAEVLAFGRALDRKNSHQSFFIIPFAIAGMFFGQNKIHAAGIRNNSGLIATPTGSGISSNPNGISNTNGISSNSGMVDTPLNGSNAKSDNAKTPLSGKLRPTTPSPVKHQNSYGLRNTDGLTTTPVAPALKPSDLDNSKEQGDPGSVTPAPTPVESKSEGTINIIHSK